MAATAHAHLGNPMFQLPRLYDLMLRLFWRTEERTYRRKVVELASLQKGDKVLDVGSGTGTLAIEAAIRAGTAGQVTGIDRSPQMIARARAKAGRARLTINFTEGSADDLPFGDGSFDVVLSMTVLHCIPDRLTQSIQEMVRVLKPGGRLFLVDFGGPQEARKSIVSRMRPHRQFDIRSIVPFVRKMTVVNVNTDELGFSDLHFVSATKS